MPLGPKKIARCEWRVFFLDGFRFRLETAILLSSLSQICNLERKFFLKKKKSFLHRGNYSDWKVDFILLLVEQGVGGKLEELEHSGVSGPPEHGVGHLKMNKERFPESLVSLGSH